MEPDSPASLASPASLRSLIASYVQKSAEQTEKRAFKALSILQAKDIELLSLQRRVLELETSVAHANVPPYHDNEETRSSDVPTPLEPVGVPTSRQSSRPVGHVRRAQSAAERRSPSPSPKRTRSMLQPSASQYCPQQLHMQPDNYHHATMCLPLDERSVGGTSRGIVPHSAYSANVYESENVSSPNVGREILPNESGYVPVLFGTKVEYQSDDPVANRLGSRSAIRIQSGNHQDQRRAHQSDIVLSEFTNPIIAEPVLCRTSTNGRRRTPSDTDDAYTSCDDTVSPSACPPAVKTAERRWLQPAVDVNDETECLRCQCRLCTNMRVPVTTAAKDESKKRDTIASHLQKSKFVHSHGNPSSASVHIPLLNLPQTPDTASDSDNSTTGSIAVLPQIPASGTSDLRLETGKPPAKVQNNLNGFGNFVTSIIGVGNTCDQHRSEEEIQLLAEDYMKRFLDVKLIEASNICRGMKGESRGLEAESACASPASLVLSDRSSVTSKSSELSSTLDIADAAPLLTNQLEADNDASLNDACVEQAAPLDLQRRVIDHLMHYNHQLKTELSRLEEQTRTEKALHLAELDKLQQWVDTTKKSAKTLCHRSSQTIQPPQHKQNNADTQTDNQPLSLEIPQIQTKIVRHVSSQTAPLYIPDSTTTDKQSEERTGNDKSCDAEKVVKVMVTREVQTELKHEKECFCQPLGETELPPQWLLAEALATRHSPPFTNISKEKCYDQDNVKECETLAADMLKTCFPKPSLISKSSQVDFINSNKKDKTINLQEELITSLTAKVSKLDKERHSLKDELEKTLKEERSANQKMRMKLEEKMINYCDILVGSGMTPSSDGERSETEASLTSTSRLASSMASSVVGVTPSKMHKFFKNTSGSERLDIYAMNSYKTIMKRKTKQLRNNYDKIKIRIANEKKDIRIKRETQKTLEISITKLKCELQQLQEQLRVTSLNSCNRHMNDVTDVFDDKLGKHSDNTKTRSTLARLRDANQQIIARSRAVQSLEQELEDARKDVIAIKSRLSRAESMNQNKQLIVDNYKKRVQELENISTQTSNKNTSLSSELRVLKDTTNCMKKQITNLQSEISCLLSEKKEFEAQKAHDRKITDQNIKVLMKKLHAAQSEAETHACVLEEETKDKVLRLKDNADCKIESVKQKLKQAGKRIEEFTRAIEHFVRLLHKNYQQEDCDSNTGADPKVAATPANQTRALVCSILNLTHGELDNLMDDTDQPRGNNNNHRKLEKWLHECRQILSNEKFSEKLSVYLFEKIHK